MPMSIVDTHVYLSRWPFRRLPGDEPAALVAKLNSGGVVEAWAGSFDAILHRDMGGVNLRLAEECKRHGAGLLSPVGSVNPMLPDWQEDLRRCHEVFHMRAIRLHPNYHGYQLTDAQGRELLASAAKRGLLVQIVMSMEDERTQHPKLQVLPVPLAPLPDVVRSIPGLRCQLLNHRGLTPTLAKQLVQAGDVCLDFATVESVHGLANLVKDVSSARVAFGSHFPFYEFESAVLKIKEAGLAPEDEAAVTSGTARKLLGGRR
jgi:predicted TIM-barrel fold metal-dependent hydrolase